MPETNEINDSLADFEDELSKLKSATDEIKKAENVARLTVDESKTIIKELISYSKNATDSAIQESKKLNESAKKLFNAVNVLMEKLDRVDFPTRLDKIDTSVSTINSAIQNVFGRFDAIEKNIKDDFDFKMTDVGEKLESSRKLNLVFLILISIFTGGSFFILLFKFVFN